MPERPISAGKKKTLLIKKKKSGAWSYNGKAVADITQLLNRWRLGDETAYAELFPLFYGELRRLAQSYLNHDSARHTLEGTALVHEAYLRLTGQAAVDWQSQGHFMAIAAQAMRRILVEHGWRRNADKRRAPVISLEEGIRLGTGLGQLDALDEALNRLADRDRRRAKVVELRFFGGMSAEQIGAHLSISPATVQRDWLIARAWQYREIGPSKGTAHGE